MKRRHLEMIRTHGEYLAMIAELEKMTEGKPLSDAVAIQLAQWKGKLTVVTKELENMPKEQEQMKTLQRGHFERRNHSLRMAREKEEATAQLKFWDKKLRSVQVQLSLVLSERGLQMEVIQQPELQDRSLID